MLGVLPDGTAAAQKIEDKHAGNDIVPNAQGSRHDNSQGNLTGKLFFRKQYHLIFFHDRLSLMLGQQDFLKTTAFNKETNAEKENRILRTKSFVLSINMVTL
jgi:hypothetical protein